MKRKLIIPVNLILLVFIIGCQKPAYETSDHHNLNNLAEKTFPRNLAGVEINRDAYFEMVAANEARLALLGSEASRNGCVKTAVVPDEYETIQEAMDAVCQNGNIIVKDGTYNENVLINKPGLSIKAVGDVIVNGCFYLYSVADKVVIENFKIYPEGPSDNAYNGIYGYGIHKAEIINNTIIGVGNMGYGILLENSSGVSILENQLSGFSWGIVFLSFDGISSSNNNLIQGNSVSGITFASCIGLEGDCNHNLVNGNIIDENPNIANAGICLKGIGAKLPDNNTLEYNTLTDNYYTGIWIVNGSNNTVGQGNTCKNTYGEDGIGFYFSETVCKTKVINNSVLENYLCDIVYEGGADITFEENIYGCLDEW